LDALTRSRALFKGLRGGGGGWRHSSSTAVCRSKGGAVDEGARRRGGGGGARGGHQSSGAVAHEAGGEPRAGSGKLRGGGEPPRSLLSWRQLGTATLQRPPNAPLLPTLRSFPTSGLPHAALLPASGPAPCNPALGVLPQQYSVSDPPPLQRLLPSLILLHRTIKLLAAAALPISPSLSHERALHLFPAPPLSCNG
jgi:hypothetical protein